MHPYRYQLGFTLIEVLIAWALLTTVLLNIVTLQLHNSRHLYHSYLQTVAILQLDNMVARLRANPDTKLWQRELNIWNAHNQQVLPQGKGTYYCVHRACQVNIAWYERTLQHVALTILL